MFAQAYVRAGRTERAPAMLDEALAKTEQSGERGRGP
jgi:hypothetical protein